MSVIYVVQKANNHVNFIIILCSFLKINVGYYNKNCIKHGSTN